MADLPIPEALVPPPAAADFLGVSERTLEGWRARGGGPEFVTISKRCVRYRPEALRDFIDERTHSSTTAASV